MFRRPVRPAFVALFVRPGGPVVCGETTTHSANPVCHAGRSMTTVCEYHAPRSPATDSEGRVEAPPSPPDSFLGPPFRGDCKTGGVRSGESASGGMTGLTQGMFHVKHRAILPRNLVAMFGWPVRRSAPPFGYTKRHSGTPNRPQNAIRVHQTRIRVHQTSVLKCCSEHVDV